MKKGHFELFLTGLNNCAREFSKESRSATVSYVLCWNYDENKYKVNPSAYQMINDLNDVEINNLKYNNLGAP